MHIYQKSTELIGTINGDTKSAAATAGGDSTHLAGICTSTAGDVAVDPEVRRLIWGSKDNRKIA